MRCPQCGGTGQRATARTTSGRELMRHELYGTPCDACRGQKLVCDFCQQPMDGEKPTTNDAGGFAHVGCLADFEYDRYKENAGTARYEELRIEELADEHRASMGRRWTPEGGWA